MQMDPSNNQSNDQASAGSETKDDKNAIGESLASIRNKFSNVFDDLRKIGTRQTGEIQFLIESPTASIEGGLTMGVPFSSGFGYQVRDNDDFLQVSRIVVADGPGEHGTFYSGIYNGERLDAITARACFHQIEKVSSKRGN